ncbi:MAG: ATP/GTP-binding protein [Nitrososphaeraceae archaeon]
MHTIFVTGTAGSGKSTLTSILLQWYKDHDAFPISLNLDTAVTELPYEPHIDVRDYVDINEIMIKYNLGPNGSIIIANDILVNKMQDIQKEVDEYNADYVIVDTPGQIELFAYRSSGPFFVSNFESENKMNIFLFDGVLASSAINFVALSLLATSINLRFQIPQVNVITKRDLIINDLEKLLNWTNQNNNYLQKSLTEENNIEFGLLSKDLVNDLYRNGIGQNFVALSNKTMNGITDLSATISRILNQGEEVNY